MVLILSQIHLVHTSAPTFAKIYSNTILLLRLDFPSGLFPSGFPTNILYVFIISPMRATAPPIPFISTLSDCNT
jgi:hypothetical protein